MADALDWLRQALGGPATPEVAPGASWEAMQQGTAATSTPPSILQYAQDVLSGRMAASGPVGQNAAYDPTKSFRENALRPDGLEAAMSMVGPAAIRAFHGSPHDFTRFDISHIGRGQGSQMQGKGLYFAEAEPVASRYRQDLATGDYSLIGSEGRIPDWLGKQIAQYPPGHEYYNAVVDRGLAEFRKRLAETNAQLKTSQQPWLLQDNIAGLQQIVGNLEKLRSGAVTLAPRGRMYEVDIHADPKAFLDLDAPWAAQSASVQRGINDVHGSFGESYVGTGYAPMLAGTPEFAARLNAAGIPGTRYLDQYSRSTIPNPTRNYVVFDDKTTSIEILRKYGLLPPLAAGAASGLLGNE